MEPHPDNSSMRPRRATPSWHYVPQKRRLLPEDPFYDDGNIHCSVQHKQMPIEDQEPEKKTVAKFPCHVSGCPSGSFTSIQDYEVHYNSAHRNVCGTCSRAFPSGHLLDIHVSEWHDAMFQVLAQKQPMFVCLVQSCATKFTTAEERKVHLIKVHQYPKDFRFDRRAKNKGIGQPQGQSHSTGDDSMDVSSASSDSQSSVTKSSVTSSAPTRQYKVPKNICFGRGGMRTFQRPRNKNPHPKKKTSKVVPGGLSTHMQTNSAITNASYQRQGISQEMGGSINSQTQVEIKDHAEEDMELQVSMETR